MPKIEFEGWFDRFTEGKYDCDVIVNNYSDEEKDKTNIENQLTFRCKSGGDYQGQIHSLKHGDKIRVTAFIVGRVGISKTTEKEYHIVELRIAKADGIKILVPAKVEEKKPEAEQEEQIPDDMPF